MITITYIDYNVQMIEQFRTWKEAKERALKLAKLGCKSIKIVRPVK